MFGTHLWASRRAEWKIESIYYFFDGAFGRVVNDIQPRSSLDLINALYVTRRVSLSAPQLLLERVLITSSLFTQDSFKVFRRGARPG